MKILKNMCLKSYFCLISLSVATLYFLCYTNYSFFTCIFYIDKNQISKISYQTRYAIH